MSEESVIKLSEKESLRKSFLLFFGTITLFLSFIFYQYARIEEEHLRENIFLEMKNYSLFFEDERFETAVIPSSKTEKPYELYEDSSSLYLLLPTPPDSTEQLKIYYPKSLYLPQLHQIQRDILWQFLFSILIALLIALLFSLYALGPLRRSLHMMEEFIKDMIHDLTTPLSAIRISLKMMDRQDKEVATIEHSAKAISMLHHNLDTYLKELQIHNERFSLRQAVQEQIDFFASTYDYLRWETAIEERTLYSDRYAFSRILYNLLSNACKYNTPQGEITIRTTGDTLLISNSSYGIKHPERIFERFYKEHERGLGIGLHIVEKLCAQLAIPKKITQQEKRVTIALDLSKISGTEVTSK